MNDFVYFTVRLFRGDGPHGLFLKPYRPGVPMAIDHTEAGSAADKWNEHCRTTFPDEQIKRDDRVVSINGISIGKATRFNVMDSHRPIVDAMCEELRRFEQEIYQECVLVVARLVKMTPAGARSVNPFTGVAPLEAHSRWRLHEAPPVSGPEPLPEPVPDDSNARPTYLTQSPEPPPDHSNPRLLQDADTRTKQGANKISSMQRDENLFAAASSSSDVHVCIPPMPTRGPPRPDEEIPPPQPSDDIPPPQPASSDEFEYVSAHLLRQGRPLGLGLNYDGGRMTVMAIQHESPASLWNRQCDETFPHGKIQIGDVIVRVNGINVDLNSMMEEIRRLDQDDCLLVLQRRLYR